MSAWKLCRHINEGEQRFSRFSGWIIEMMKNEEVKPTVLTYLPPIEAPITDYNTIFEVFYQSEQEKDPLQSNPIWNTHTYFLIVVLQWRHFIFCGTTHKKFSKIILHLGDFHVLQAFFGATGSYITGSGFEDVIYQLGLCQPRSMSSLLKGKRYNQSWLIHGSMAEAICRLFQKAFVDSLPYRLVEAEHCDLPTPLRDDATRKYLEEYLKGDDDKTAHYWLQ